MSYKLFLDDKRNPPDKNWIIVRNYDEFCEKIAKLLPCEISFDIDLGEIHTGFDCIKFLGKILQNKKLENFIKIYCHSGSMVSLQTFVEDVLNDNAEYMGRLEDF